MNPNSPMAGRIVSWSLDPELADRRAVLLVRPGPSRGILAVLVTTELGSSLLELEVTGAEILKVQAPYDGLPPEYKARVPKAPDNPRDLVTLPGKLIFSRADGEELIFLGDCNAGAYSLPLGVELPRVAPKAPKVEA